MNSWIDSAHPFQEMGGWHGNVQVQSYYKNRPLEGAVDDGVNLQHIYEAWPFETAIDHAGWYPAVRHYMGVAQPSIHEMFVNVRGPGGHITGDC
jgi:hypothetical protein